MHSKTIRYLIIAVVACLAVFAGYHYIHTASSHDQVKKTQPAKKSTPQRKGMDLNAIKSGDFSSVSGTWKNPAGDTYVFTKSGLKAATFNGETRSDSEVYLTGVNNIPAATIDHGMLKTFIGPKNHDNIDFSSAMSTYFIPKTAKLDGTSNPSIDRIYTGQQQDDKNVFTKVD
ncbi:hypothetical protein G6R29_05150 [Fructobacillus sp. M2-14]|uniref:DUF6287 domain-containing protein n=1 Tax=Fructobacillus broussonetiae TaxID=2713173 RepID=A0ABS5R0P0_9LACO|nr:DUF6287 domain-containing protein [Fructobacillus broussonetiae]MBS9339006.1 hypothetical protein [Fructobacillus broussonetiae]